MSGKVINNKSFLIKDDALIRSSFHVLTQYTYNKHLVISVISYSYNNIIILNYNYYINIPR